MKVCALDSHEVERWGSRTSPARSRGAEDSAVISIGATKHPSTTRSARRRAGTTPWVTIPTCPRRSVRSVRPQSSPWSRRRQHKSLNLV